MTILADSHQGRIDLLFVFVIRADRSNESSGRDVFLSHEEFAGVVQVTQMSLCRIARPTSATGSI